MMTFGRSAIRDVHGRSAQGKHGNRSDFERRYFNLMANYGVRVELRGDPPAEDYEILHALMSEMGFRQTVVGVDSQGANKTFRLPHATYYGSSIDDCSTVRDTLSSLIKTRIQKEIIVFVVQVYAWAIGY